MYDNILLLSHLLMFLGSLNCKQYEPRSDCSKGSCLIRVHSACFHKIIESEMHLNICICSRHKKQTTFSEQKNSGGIGVNGTFLCLQVSYVVEEDCFCTPLKEPIPHQYSQCFDFYVCRVIFKAGRRHYLV